MRVVIMKDVQQFSARIEPLLLRKEACNNLMLGILEREKTSQNGEVLMGLVEKDNHFVYGFIQTPPHDLVLPDIEIQPDIFPVLARWFIENQIKLPGVIGSREVADAFVQAWSQETKLPVTLHMEQLIYQLTHVNDIGSAPGRLTLAKEADKDLYVKWMQQFGRETNEEGIQDRAHSLITHFLKMNSLFVWEVDGVPVSMVNQSRKTKNGVTINAVYTPDEYKRKGYATTSVTTLTQKLLEEGNRFCALYTDKANPTSNQIYQRIGYKTVGDSIVYKFGD
ncbi:GNAT family N-acetyltransferase [Radiobacillus deserti]|uniref:GNAT family N-acetyltransferase n=1 Tax=Radiobacillus deserti TaxID=2594883 RepID=A0A516KK13_9BACI|nr:GNAT family N-acetyltransferase [Radiobacillus deserti]QDP41721.1 GNAT family N-acetyltransferase [Radiobacillus deserti]